MPTGNEAAETQAANSLGVKTTEPTDPPICTDALLPGVTSVLPPAIVNPAGGNPAIAVKSLE